MKIVIAPDSYKGCLTAREVAAAAAAGIRASCPGMETVCMPVADGGEGTVDALMACLGGSIVTAAVTDPLGRPIDAEYGICGDLAVIECASACGLTLLKKEERNPLFATTRGLGEMIVDAKARGCSRFIIGLGGSATNDGGRGMIETPGLMEAAAGSRFTVACDVDTPYIGPKGASRTFGPQKGATPKDIEILESRLCTYASRILEETGVDVRDLPGAGAAGGLGGAFHAFLHADLLPGAEIVLDAANFDAVLENADLVITGEGCSDFQTPMGKVPVAVLKRAASKGVPVVLMSGSICHCQELDGMGFAAMETVTPEGMPLSEAMAYETAMANIKSAAGRIIRTFKD